ncbi:MAG TPA: FecR domain-containing protein [Pseudosphingobacterium sp.]|nr:FecR domain-containing protein [Pseudosphingobacterium sp.]
MKKENFNSLDLIRRYFDGNCTEEEKQLIEDWYESLPEGKLDVGEPTIEHDLELVFTKLRQERIKRSQRFLWQKIAAAVVLLLLTLAVYQYYRFIQTTNPLQVVAAEIEPATDRATLTLADGTTINLDSVAIGILSHQYGTDISKTEPGVISYQLEANKTQLDIAASNTITTPRGGYYKVILPDSSCVWVNAASSLSFPTRFAEDERRVELAGEAYFQVAKNTRKPFIVRSGRQEIRVLGTEFNVKAYKEEPVATTLVSGRVSVKDKSGKAAMLAPGQQALSSATGLSVSKIDIEDFTGWKSGQFIFHGTDLKTVMLQLERWYNIDVDITNLPDVHFYAEISRNKNLSDVLQMLEKTSGLKFKLNKKERRLIVE